MIGRAAKALCAFLLCALVAPVEGALVTSNTTVVLVAGLPGDLESTKEYDDEIHSWLEFIAGQSFKGNVIVLSDSELENSPLGLSLEKHKATREQFLLLGEPRGSSTNSLLMVVCGHGGTQGRTPVLHVRGPRLTPGDFKTVASRFKAESRWVLFFRGSGSFAKEIAAPGQSILSSENETAYSSDPIAMPLLLKIVADNTAPDFSNAAEVLGIAVKRWYEERNLARTEEPTLWVGLENPRLLATDNSPESLKKSGPTNNETMGTVSLTNLPAVWKEIRRVEAQLYPTEDAVTLSRNITYTIGDHPALSTDQDEFIQILTIEGKHFGDFDFHFSPPGEDIRFIACEVLKANGELVKLDPDAIHESAPSGLPDFGTLRRKIFSLPHIEPGAIVHVHVQTIWQSFPLAHISTQIPLDSETPVLRETVRVSIPRGGAFHFAFENIQARDPELKQGEYGTTYFWKFENLDARSHQALSPPMAQPRLLVSTFPDWADFVQWYGRICQLSDEITPEISAKAAELTRDAKTDEEKIAAVFRYVTGLRYVAVEMGINSFRPHAAGNVLRNQYGDCKDKANLFNTLMRSLNIEGLSANLVLVPRFSQANEQTPGLAFNHAIARVVLRDKTYWVDTTDDVCRFGMLPPGDPGRNVLVIDGKSVSLTPLPQPLPKDHRLQLHARVNCAASLQAPAPISIEVEAAGFPDYELREMSRELKRNAANTPLLDTKFRMASGVFTLVKQSFSDVSALQTNFCLRMEGEIIGSCSAIGDRRVLLRLPAWLPAEWKTSVHRRTSALSLNQGYPIQLEESVEWDLPGANIDPSAPKENNDGPLKWRIDWHQDGKTVVGRLQAELASGEIAASDVPRFQTQLRQMLSALDSGAQCKISP